MAGLPKPSLALPALVLLGLLEPARAEIATDGSVGPRMDLPGPEFAIPADLGRQADGNLFHSFERFSLATGERATFSGPDQIENVISRVTGGEPSEIDGTLRSTMPNADFYFINPAGILFGPNASLDLQGSFHVSTANELRFTDDTKFSATDPAASSLTVAAPEAFGFLGSTPASILVDESILEVPAGEAFSIVGGDIDIVGGPEGFIRAEAGRITLAAVGGPGQVHLDSGALDAVRQEDISLSDLALLDTSGDGGGTIHIGSSQVIIDRSSLLAQNIGSTDATGGIEIQADSVSILEGSNLFVDGFGSGAAGEVRISANNIRLASPSTHEFTSIRAGTHANGDGGAIVITQTILCSLSSPKS